MSKFSVFLISTTLVVLVTGAFAAGDHTVHNHAAHYAGQEKREIKSLSQADVTELLDGGGWGFAKSAELNGVPGPSHLLELQKELELTSGQIEKIRQVFHAMKHKARDLGRQFVELEKQLEKKFRSRSISAPELQQHLTEIEKVRGDLRYVHLHAHLEMLPVVSREQIVRYNRLRGYSVSE